MGRGWKESPKAVFNLHKCPLIWWSLVPACISLTVIRDTKKEKRGTAATPAALSHHRAALAMGGPAVEKQNSCREVASVECPAGTLPQNSSSPKATWSSKVSGDWEEENGAPQSNQPWWRKRTSSFGAREKKGLFVIVIQESPKPLSPAVFRPSRFRLKPKKKREINFPGLIQHSWNAEIKPTLIVASAGKKCNQRRGEKRKVRTNHLLINWRFPSGSRFPLHIILLVVEQ